MAMYFTRRKLFQHMMSLEAELNRFYNALVLWIYSSTTMLRRVTSEIDTVSTCIHTVHMYVHTYLVHYVQ